MVNYLEDSIDVLGRDFGKQSQQPKAFIGGVPCKQTLYISEHHLQCIVPAALGKTDYRNKSVIVTALDMSNPGSAMQRISRTVVASTTSSVTMICTLRA